MANATLPYPLNLLLDAYDKAERELPKLDTDRQKGLDHILDELSDREREIIYLRYEKGVTLEDIGSRFGVTRERIRMLEQVALEKLGRKLHFVEDGYMIASGEVDRMAKERITAALEKAVAVADTHKSVRDIPLDKLDLNRRTANLLKRNGIWKTEELMELSEQQMRKFRGVGNATLQDIYRAREQVLSMVNGNG